MSRLPLAVGLCGVAALGAALPAGLQLVPAEEELRVDLPTAARYLERGDEPRRLEVGPPELVPRMVEEVRGADGPLELRTWIVEYGSGRWVREVTMPIVPRPPGNTVACGFHVDLGLELLEAKGPGSALGDLLVREINRRIPPSVHPEDLKEAIVIARVATASLSVATRSGNSAVLSLRLIFEDGTWLDVSQLVGVDARAGSVRVAPISTPTVAWGGALHGRIHAVAERSTGIVKKLLAEVLEPGGFRGAVERQANTAVHQQTAAAVGPLFVVINRELARLTLPFLPGPNSPTPWRLFLGEPPALGDESLHLSVCITDAPELPMGPPPDRAPDAPLLPRDGVRVYATPLALHRLAHLAWGAGLAREQGRRADLLAALPPAVQQLAFQVTGFDPGLPPVVGQGEGDALHLAVADLQLGTWDDRRVVAHVAGRLLVDSRDGAIGVAVQPRFFRLNCASPLSGGGVRLEPCLSELLPALREELLDRPRVAQWPGSTFLEALPRLAFHGLRVNLSRLTARTSASPPGLTATATVRLAKDER